ncbi:MAG: phenylalanine--tRNA ligase subunit beta [Phycisphaerales bacterium]
MKTSVRWLNLLLSGSHSAHSLTGEQIEAVLMAQGLPSETREAVQTCAGSDECLDVEVTSNRGDCLSHVGLARELAASPQLRVSLRHPAPDADDNAPSKTTTDWRAEEHPAELSPAKFEKGENVTSLFALQNTIPDLCPLFLVRVIRGVKVKESPAWLRSCLEAIGQRPINNIVDVTNFIAAELGNPCHVFDMAKMAGNKIVVRLAKEGEALTTLDGKQRKLKADEVVVADGGRAQGLAGVMGGADSEVSASTVDVVLEMATWDHVAVRRAARRHQLRTTASHRYERIVDPRTLEAAANRAAALIALLGGGTVCPGTLSAGKPLEAPTTVRLRPQRCRAILGIQLNSDRMVQHLHAVGVKTGPLGRGGDELLCTIPVHRPDLTREIDLIEEVARIEGLDAINVQDRMLVRVRAPQQSERARRELASVLTGLGFYETVTFSFTTPKHAKSFCPTGLEPIVMDDARRGDEPALRPSVLTGLLACRMKNQHAGVAQPPGVSSVGHGGVRLFEVASAYAQKAGKRDAADTVEHLNVGLLLDCPGKSIDDQRAGIRHIRGTIESLVKALAGDVRKLRVEPAAPHAPAFDKGAFAKLSLITSFNTVEPLGYFGLLDKSALASFDLATPVAVAEVNLGVLTSQYPPRSRVFVPPALPGIERDVSLVVAEDLRYDTIRTALESRKRGSLEDVQFVTTYRGKPFPQGKKSVTVRLSFREAGRTLTHEEVDAPINALLNDLKSAFPFEIRS